MTTVKMRAILITENKKHGSIRELQLSHAYIGDTGTHATDINPHRRISIPVFPGWRKWKIGKLGFCGGGSP